MALPSKSKHCIAHLPKYLLNLCFSRPTTTTIIIPGLDAELFYVRNGVVNSYAMIFVVPVPANMYDLEFSWQSLTEYPVRDYPLNEWLCIIHSLSTSSLHLAQLRYRVSIEYESQLGGLLAPHLSIPIKGYVPITLETFTIHLPCTGNVSEEVPVGINLVVEGSPNFNNTHMTFKRNKICLKGTTNRKRKDSINDIR